VCCSTALHNPAATQHRAAAGPHGKRGSIPGSASGVESGTPVSVSAVVSGSTGAPGASGVLGVLGVLGSVVGVPGSGLHVGSVRGDPLIQ
jgi:hypothetical protein